MARSAPGELTVPPDVAELVRTLLDGGLYASGEDVLREAMQLLQRHEAGRTEFMRQKIAEADADPRPDLTDEEVTEHFRRRARSDLARRDHA